MTIKDVARETVVTATPEESAMAVAQTMREENVGSTVVVDDDEPVGIITDRDLALHVVSENADAAELTAAELMTENPFTVTEEAGVYGVLSRIADVGVRRVPIVDHDGAITGIVTLDDFVVLLTNELENVSEVIQVESPPY